MKGDPDSATSPSKYLALFSIPGQQPSPKPEAPGLTRSLGHQDITGVGSLDQDVPGFGSTSEEEVQTTTKRKRLRKRKSRRDLHKVEPEPDLKPEPEKHLPPRKIKGKTNDSLKMKPPQKTPKSKKNSKTATNAHSKVQSTISASDPTQVRGNSQPRKSLTSYELKDYLSKTKIATGWKTVSTVIETVKRLEDGNQADDIVEVEGSLTSASTVRSIDNQKHPPPKQPFSKPTSKNPLLANKFRETVFKMVAKTSVPKIKINDDEKTSQVYDAVTKSNDDFEAQIRAMKHIPPASKDTKKVKIPSTQKVDSTKKMGLPPIAVQAGTLSKKQKIPPQFTAEYDKNADLEFYSDFKFTFIPLPIPTDELPRELMHTPLGSNTWKLLVKEGLLPCMLHLLQLHAYCTLQYAPSILCILFS